MSFDYKDWIKIYEKNIKKQHIEIIKNSIIGIPLINFIEDNPKWGGSSLTLLYNIGKVAENLGISIKQKAFPKTAHKFSQRLREIEPSLKEVGINVIRSKEERIEEHILINKIYELDVLDDLKRKYTLDKHFEDSKKLEIVYECIKECQKLTGVAKVEIVFKLLLDEHKIDKDEAEYFIDKLIENKRIIKTEDGDYKTIDEPKDERNETSRDEIEESETRRRYNVQTFKVDAKKEKKKKTLKEKLEIVYNVISETQKLTEVANAETVFNLLLEVHEIDRDEAEKLISILMRDGRIFEPRPRYYKTI